MSSGTPFPSLALRGFKATTQEVKRKGRSSNFISIKRRRWLGRLGAENEDRTREEGESARMDIERRDIDKKGALGGLVAPEIAGVYHALKNESLRAHGLTGRLN